LKFVTPAVLAVAAFVVMILLHMLQKEIFDFTAFALFFGSMVWLGIQRAPAIFNARIFYWLSRLSFGMYLNHEYMCPWMVNRLLPNLSFLTSHPLAGNLAGLALISFFSALIALVTFCGVEYPFLQMRKIVLSSEQKTV